MMQNMQSTQPVELQPYQENRGVLYGAAGALLSVSYDYDAKTNSIRRHDPETGKITEVLYEDIPDGGQFIAGDDALYELVKEGLLYRLNRYPLDGNAKALLEIELDPDEKGVSVDVGQGKVMIVSYGSDFKAKSLLLYDLATDVLEEVPLKSGFGPSSRLEYEFVLVD